MEKEPNELISARASLRRWEENPGDTERRNFLRQGVRSLSDVIFSDLPEVYKTLAKKLIIAYRNRVLSEAKGILVDSGSRELAYLEH